MNYSENESIIHCQNCGGDYEAELTECPYCHASTEENLSKPAPKAAPTVAELGGGFGEPGSTIGRVAALIVVILLLLSAAALLWTGRSLLTKGFTIPQKPDSSAVSSGEAEPDKSEQGDKSEQEEEKNEEKPKKAKSVTLDTNSITLAEGEVYQLIPSVLPNDWEGELTWVSDNKKIASVDQEGKLTNVNGGDCTITVTAGDVTATCAVHCEGMTQEQKKEEKKRKEEEKKKKEEEEKKRKEEEERRKQEEEAAAAAQSSGGLKLTLGGKSYEDNDFTLVHVGESYTFEVNGGDGNYSASSSDSSVVSVSGTKTTATGVGMAIVTWKSGDGKSVSATIRVSQP